MSRRKIGQTDSNGTLIFRFTLNLGKSGSSVPGPSLSLVEFSSSSLLGCLQKNRIKKNTEFPLCLRALEAAYDSSLVKRLIRVLNPSPKTSFCYIINFAQVEDEAAESLLQMSQLLNEQEIIQQAPSFLAKDQLSSGIKLILSKKSAKKSDQKKGRDRTPSRVEDNPRKKEHFR